MAILPDYRPVRPSRADRRRAVLHQSFSLPGTLARVSRIVSEDFAPEALDEHLWAFAGFHQESRDPHYRARTWQKAAFNAIRPNDVIGMPAPEFALMLHVAMEIEEPIVAYSRQAGEGFRLLLPALSRFMGKSQDEARHADEHGEAWCESVWCAEERRHASTFARLIERITGKAPLRDNPNDPMAAVATESEALKLLVGRQSSEWNASSVYVVMAAHAKGELLTVIRNVARDEIKHLAILSAADRYLHGPRAWRRFNELIRLALSQYRGHRRRRSAGDYIGTNPLSALEVIVVHVLAEWRIRRWMASIPLCVLTTVFETPSDLPEPAGFAPSPEEDPQAREAARDAKARRMNLSRWETTQRGQAMDQRAWEEASASVIERLVTVELRGFAGAGLPGSAEARQTRQQIRGLSSGRLRTALLGRLRHHQVVHNRHVLARPSR